MLKYVCDICGHVREEDERFFHLAEITTGDRKLEIDFCLECYNRFKNSEEKGEN